MSLQLPVPWHDAANALVADRIITGVLTSCSPPPEHEGGKIVSQATEALHGACAAVVSLHVSTWRDQGTSGTMEVESRPRSRPPKLQQSCWPPISDDATTHLLGMAHNLVFRGNTSHDNTDCFLRVAAVRAAYLASMDEEASTALLEEPWLSFLTASIASVVEFSDATLMAAYGAAVALVGANFLRERGEVGFRGTVRLGAELLVPQCARALLQSAAREMIRGEFGTEVDNQPEFEPPAQLTDRVRACNSLGCLSRHLLEMISDDFAACAVLLDVGALPALFRIAKSEGGAVAAGLSGSLAALSSAPGFAHALANLPSVHTSELVDLAALELLQLDGSAHMQPAVGALFNACRSEPVPPLPQRLVDQGAISVLVDIIRSVSAGSSLRLEAAESLCRLPQLGGDAQVYMPPAAMRCIAEPSTVAALITLCPNKRVSLINTSSALRGPREALKYRLPWLLACVARGANAGDLLAWMEESVGVRALILDSLGHDRAREVRAWGLDMMAAVISRVPPDQLLDFLHRGPQSLIEVWPSLMSSNCKGIQARAMTVGFFIASCMPTGDTRDQLLILLSSDCTSAPVSQTLGWKELAHARFTGIGACELWSPESMQRQHAEVAIAAAHSITAEPLPVAHAIKKQGTVVHALCNIVMTGLDAVSMCGCIMGMHPGDNVAVVLSSWLLKALELFWDLLESGAILSPSVPTHPHSNTLRVQFAVLLSDIIVMIIGEKAKVCDSLEMPHRIKTEVSTASLQEPTCNKWDRQEESDDENEFTCHSEGGMYKALLGLASQLLEGLLFRHQVNVSSVGLSPLPHATDAMNHNRDLFHRLALATTAQGGLEYGRLLTRTLIRSDWRQVHCQAEAELSQGSDHATVHRRSAAGTLLETNDLDALVSSDRERTASPRVLAAFVDIDLRTWVEKHMMTGKGKGLHAVFRFLDQPGLYTKLKERWVMLVEAVLQCLTTYNDVLKLFHNSRTVELLLQLAVGLLVSPGQLQAGDIGPSLALHKSVVGVILPATGCGCGWNASTFAEGFAYLWALLHFSASVEAQSLETAGYAADSLWDVATKAILALLSDPAILEILCHSDDNAAGLLHIRWALGDASGAFALFSKACILTPPTQDSSDVGFDLHEASWCPPGRILLAAVVRLAPLVFPCLNNSESEICSRRPIHDFLKAALEVSGRIVAAVACPKLILHSAADVLALLRVAAAIIKSPPAGDQDSASWQRYAGLLFVPLLHRPPIENILAPCSALQALPYVPEGQAALEWCARLQEETGLQGWGMRARALLHGVDGISSFTLSLAQTCSNSATNEVAAEVHPVQIDSNSHGKSDAHAPSNEVTSGCAAQATPTVIDSVKHEEICEAKDVPKSENFVQFAGTKMCCECQTDECSPFVDTLDMYALSELKTMDCHAQAAAYASTEEGSSDMETERLRNEVCAMDDELDSLEAELANLSSTDAEEDYKVDIAVDTRVTGSDCAVSKTSCSEVATQVDDAPEMVKGEPLPEEGQQFLSLLLSGDGHLAGTRDAVLSVLVRSSQRGDPLSTFQAQALLEVFREPLDEVPSASVVRHVLAFLYENLPALDPPIVHEEQFHTHPQQEIDEWFIVEASSDSYAAHEATVILGNSLSEMD